MQRRKACFDFDISYQGIEQEVGKSRFSLHRYERHVFNDNKSPMPLEEALAPYTQHGPPVGEKQERIARLLVESGIHARDFAYESTLPPIAPVRHVRQQIQPGALRRGGEFAGEEDDHEPQTFYCDAEAGGTTVGLRPRKRKRPIERTPTEPVDEEPSQGPCPLSGGPLRLSQRRHWGADLAPRLLATPRKPFHPVASTPISSPGNRNTHSPSQPGVQGTSQESEWIDTPLVTPNGSFQWPVADSSAVPASQLDSASQLPVPEDVTFSQLGFSSQRTPQRTPNRGRVHDRAVLCSPIRAPVFAAADASTPSASPEALPPPPQPLPPREQSPAGSPRKRRRKDNTEAARDAPPSRYFLRERAVAPTRLPPPPRSSSRTASSRHAASSGRVSPAKNAGGTRTSPSRRQPKRNTRSSRRGEQQGSS
ncbi:hypothetical protein IEO21_09027 [Rhodonia placenta]|uniref:Uncharacterized protein n=1 Tax=Rhodonia placenta TaxID=104341 RepID=A0A8H7NV13_9APHY|nr:hypothetical protein IEO21_09027 [Postia placenta]